MPWVTRWDGHVRLALCVQDGGQVDVSLSVVKHHDDFLSNDVTRPWYFLSHYLRDCPPRKLLYAIGADDHIYSMEKLDWMLDARGDPQWRVTKQGNSWSDFESTDELLNRVQDAFDSLPYPAFSPGGKRRQIEIFEHTSGVVFICSDLCRSDFYSLREEVLGQKDRRWMSGTGCQMNLFDSAWDSPAESDEEEGDEEGEEEEGKEEEEGSAEEGSEEESEDEDAGEEFRSGKYAKLEGKLFGALELGAWTSFTRFEASDQCSKHMHSWAFGDVCGDLVIIRILRGEKAGGASATPQKCYVALLWDLSLNKWAYRTLPQLGPPTAGYTDQPDMLRRFESKLRKFEPPSVAAALSQAARASNSAKKARHS